MESNQCFPDAYGCEAIFSLFYFAFQTEASNLISKKLE